MKEKVLVIQLRRRNRHQDEIFFRRITYMEMRDIQSSSDGRTIAQALSQADPYSINMGVMELDYEEHLRIERGELRVVFSGTCDGKGHYLVPVHSA